MTNLTDSERNLLVQLANEVADSKRHTTLVREAYSEIAARMDTCTEIMEDRKAVALLARLDASKQRVDSVKARYLALAAHAENV